jgi:transposase InsO family protein
MLDPSLCSGEPLPQNSCRIPPSDCYDNAAVEAFWATLKRELAWIHGTTSWAHRDELRSALFDYIEGFYNPTRIQRRLAHHSPADYEQHSAA